MHGQASQYATHRTIFLLMVDWGHLTKKTLIIALNIVWTKSVNK